MTSTNPHPLANPLNQSRFRNFSYGMPYQSLAKTTRSANPKDLTVPESKTFSEVIASQQQSQLTVPNSDIPYYNGPMPAFGFLGDSPLFKLNDGSIVDLKKHRIIYDPNKKWKDQGYWNDPDSSTERQHLDIEWAPTETIESLLNRVSKPDGTYYDPNLDPKSFEYWKRADEESKKLEQNLTNEQKQLLDDLHAGKMFPMSKLVDEN